MTFIRIAFLGCVGLCAAVTVQAQPMNPMMGGMQFVGQNMAGPQPQFHGMSPDTLLRLREELTMQIQQIQQQIGRQSPNDTQFTQFLLTQRAETMQQLQAVEAQLQATAADLQDPARMPPQDMSMGMPPGWQQPQPGMMGGGMTPEMFQQMMQMQQMQQMQQRQQMPPEFGSWQQQMQMPQERPMPFGPPPAQQQGRYIAQWNTPQFDPMMPGQEVVVLQQAITDLRSEISGLRDQIRSLESQIQLLIRNTMSEPIRIIPDMNAPMVLE